MLASLATTCAAILVDTDVVHSHALSICLILESVLAVAA